MRINKSLALNPDKKTMTYMDKWSSKFTWGGDEANKPVEGDLAVLTEGKFVTDYVIVLKWKMCHFVLISITTFRNDRTNKKIYWRTNYQPDKQNS